MTTTTTSTFSADSTVVVADATDHHNPLLRFDFTTDDCINRGGRFDNNNVVAAEAEDDDDDDDATTSSSSSSMMMMSMIRNSETTICSPVGIGIQPNLDYGVLAAAASSSSSQGSSSSGLVSSTTIQSTIIEKLQQQQQQQSTSTSTNTGIIISLWIQTLATTENNSNLFDEDDENENDVVNDISNPPTPILTIGLPPTTTNTTTTTTTSTETTTSNNNGLLLLTAANDEQESELITECDKLMIDFELRSHKNTDLEIYYRTSDPFFEPCYRIYLPGVFSHHQQQQQSLYHLAIVLSDGYQQVFMNGQPASPKYEEPFDSKTLNHWNIQSLIQIFASRPNTMPWNGRIFSLQIVVPEVSMDTSTETYVRQIMAGGVVGTKSKIKPYTSSQRIEMDEVNQQQHDDHPSTYHPVIELPIGYIKNEEQELLQSLQIESHNPPDDVFTYITKLPSKGQLYHADTGTPLLPFVGHGHDHHHGGSGGNNATTTDTSSDDFGSGERSRNNVVIPLGGGGSSSSRIIYIPNTNEHSLLPDAVYTEFDYCVTTQSSIFTTSQCDSTSTIQIVVHPVNDPPIAIIAYNNVREGEGLDSYYIVHEGIIEEPKPLLLTGSDIDVDDQVSRIEITDPPKLGYLFLSVTQFRDDGLIHGTLLSAINNTITGNEAFVEYRYNMPQQQQNNKHGVVVLSPESSVMDSFKFRVQDLHGLWSDETTAYIKVVPAITVHSAAGRSSHDSKHMLLEGIEGESMTIQLSGRDGSGLDRDFGFFIETVSAHGIFTINNGPNKEQVIIGNGTLLKVVATDEEGENDDEGVHRKNISFLPSSELCSTQRDANVTLSYRFVALLGGDVDMQIVSASPVYQQKIHITCKIDPIQLHVPNGTHVVRSSFDLFMNDTCSGYMFNSSETTADLNEGSCLQSVAIFSGVTNNPIWVTSDKDLTTSSEGVFVSLSTKNLGYLTINRQQRQYIKMIDDQAEMRQSIRFYTAANKLNEVLDFLHYQNDEPGFDAIDIEVRYGNCSWSQNETEVLQYLEDQGHHRQQCITVKETIEIEVLPPDESNNNYLKTRFPFLPLPFTLLMILLIKFKGKLREKRILKTEDLDFFIDEPVSTTIVEEVVEDEEDQATTSNPAAKWIQYYDDVSGFYYYKSIQDGTVTWDVPPIDEEFIPAVEEDE